MSIGLTENDHIRFKRLLEYFVAHLEYIREYKDNTKGYNEYIKPILKNFKIAGYGYNGEKIQNQISNWCEYKPYNKICITVRRDQYPNNGCYLHWEGTYINIIAKWNQEKTSIESLTIANIPKEVNENLHELGLYNNTVPNNNLINFFNTYIEAYKEKHYNTINKIEEYVNLLKSNHNLILTGAPGTGKTYLAKEIAKAMNAEYKVVQFHPSYDYTDFVEGLRPIKEGSTLGFQRKDGVFKEFCKKALNSLIKSSFDYAYDALIDNIKKGNIKTIRLKTKESAELDIRGNDSIGWYSKTEKNNKSSNLVSKDRMKKLFDVYNTLEKLNELSNINESIRSIISGCDPSYYWGVLNYLLENNSFQSKPYVFIIDEINRGEISKIFGELFYSIDAGYRGENGKVDTQYQNLIPKEGDADFDSADADVFRNGFYVPENVYIIGTMNDIDRSVESMDFAMRRRFAWKEVTAESRIEMLNDMKTYNIDDNTIEKTKNRLRNLNAAISETEGLNSAYHIGPAYFLKLENYINDKNSMWGNLWNNHIKGVLYEYLRGYENQKNILDKLEKAYKNETEQQEEKTESNNNDSDSTNKE